MFRKLLSESEGNTLSSNISSLGVLQLANYFLPFITFPYIAITLGPEKFGLIAFANATVIYFSIFTDYGFNLTATQAISRSRGNIAKVNEVFSSVICVKFMLLLISSLLFLLLIFLVPKLSDNWHIFVISFGLVIGQMLLPLWLFHGFEKMRSIAIISVINKVCFTLCIFIFVSDEDDYLLIPSFSAAGSILVGLSALWIARNKLGITFVMPNINQLRIQIIDGWFVFASTVSMSLYASSSVFVLGFFASDLVVGLYAAADKLVQVAKGIYTPISQALFPLVSKKINENKVAGLELLQHAGLLICLGMLFICCLLFFFGDILLVTLLGQKFKDSGEILRLLAFVPVIIALSNLIGIHGLLNLGYKKEFTICVTLCAFFGVALTVILTKLYLSHGTALALIISEVLILALLGSFFVSKLRSRAI